MSWVPPLHFNLVSIAVEILGERNVQMHGNVFFGLFGVQKVGPAWIHPSNWPSSDCTRNFTEADVCWANIVVWNVDIIESLWLCHIKITYWPLCFTNKRPQCWLICSAIQDSLYRWDKTRPLFFLLSFYVRQSHWNVDASCTLQFHYTSVLVTCRTYYTRSSCTYNMQKGTYYSTNDNWCNKFRANVEGRFYEGVLISL